MALCCACKPEKASRDIIRRIDFAITMGHIPIGKAAVKKV